MTVYKAADKALNGITSTDIRRAAMDLLARREHAFQELHDKLLRRFTKSAPLKEAEEDALTDGPGSLSEKIHRQLERLRDEGLQSDARLAEAFVRARSNRGRGPLRIKQELQVKGVASQIVQTALENSEIDWIKLIEVVAAKKYGTEQLELATKVKRSRFLLQRGFSYDHIAHLD